MSDILRVYTATPPIIIRDTSHTHKPKVVEHTGRFFVFSFIIPLVATIVVAENYPAGPPAPPTQHTHVPFVVCVTVPSQCLCECSAVFRVLRAGVSGLGERGG